MEPPAKSDVPRPELTDPLVARLSETDGQTVALSTGLVGAGGFGKTSLARQVCNDPRVRRRYVAGVWVNIGQRPAGSELATIVNDTYYQLTGYRPALVTANQAGTHLGQLLDRSPHVLLVLDDVWKEEQLRPFLLGGRHCTRLVTTRRPGVLPNQPGTGTVKVDELHPEQSKQLLTAGLPPIRPEYLDALLRLTGNWPLLVRLANRHLHFTLLPGTDINLAAANLADRLANDGPHALDLADEVSRDQAAAASINASLDLLTPTADFQVDAKGLFCQLGVFAEDYQIPRALLIQFWDLTGRLSWSQVDKLCDRLHGLSLVAEYQPGVSIRVHDVIRAYLRHKAGDQLPTLNATLLSAARAFLRPTDRYRVLAAAPTAHEVTPWWRLSQDEEYLWQNLCNHIAGAGDHEELRALLTDLRWAEARIWRNGLAAFEADLALSDDPTVGTLRRALAENAEFQSFGGGHTRWTLAARLVERLRAVADLRSLVDAYLEYLPTDIRDRYPRPTPPPTFHCEDQPGDWEERDY